MFFNDYLDTKVVYHVIPIISLGDVLKNGLKVGECCSVNYYEFNKYYDRIRPQTIPKWVSRGDAIYGSMNFRSDHSWHSHSAILALRIDEERCWIGNENLANVLYEPFILRGTKIFKDAETLIRTKGDEFALKYWVNSMSFKDNLRIRLDLKSHFDAEVLIMHDIPPTDIDVIKLVSDHKLMSINEWNIEFQRLCHPRN